MQVVLRRVLCLYLVKRFRAQTRIESLAMSPRLLSSARKRHHEHRHAVRGIGFRVVRAFCVRLLAFCFKLSLHGSGCDDTHLSGLIVCADTQVSTLRASSEPPWSHIGIVILGWELLVPRNGAFIRVLSATEPHSSCCGILASCRGRPVVARKRFYIRVLWLTVYDI